MIDPTIHPRLISLETWVIAISSSACIGCTSLVPWLFNMTFFERHRSEKGTQTKNTRMDYLLSFSIGAILGDIFFHLIPESLETHLTELDIPIGQAQKKLGLSLISGIFMFIIVEMLLERWSSPENPPSSTSSRMTEVADEAQKKSMDLKEIQTADYDLSENNNNTISHCNECYHHEICREEKDCASTFESTIKFRKDTSKVKCRPIEETKTPTIQNVASDTSDSEIGANLINGPIIDPAGYLSLIANGFDNFTHGLAIGASFLVGTKVGLLTTFVIFIHEIPHEICDYAILVNSGFSRWDAVKAQSSVSLFGIMGTAAALYFKSTAGTIWILPFSAGGFLHIALVNLLPQILSRKTQLRDSIEQIGCVLVGITFMGLVALT